MSIDDPLEDLFTDADRVLIGEVRTESLARKDCFAPRDFGIPQPERLASRIAREPAPLNATHSAVFDSELPHGR